MVCNVCSIPSSVTTKFGSNYVAIDSGAGYSVFSTTSVFQELEAVPKVAIKGVAGAVDCGVPVAKRGQLKKNNLYLIKAIYFGRLPLFAIVALIDLLENGFDAVWRTRGPCELIYVDTMVSLPIFITPDGLSLVRFSVLGEALAFVAQRASSSSAGQGKTSKLLIHMRSGHIHCPEGFSRRECAECIRAIGRRVSIARERLKRHEIDRSLKLLAADFFGELTPTSVRGCKIILVIICDVSKFVIIIPLTQKSEVVAHLRRVIRALETRTNTTGERITWFLRIDNEPVLRSNAISKLADELKITVLRPTPYTPQHNGVVGFGGFDGLWYLVGIFFRAIVEIARIRS